MARKVSSHDDYLTRVLKHIPSEIVMAYVSIEGVLRTTYAHKPKTLENALWILGGILLFLTPIWLKRVMHVRKPTQLVLSTLSFPIWLFAIGGPFTTQPWYEPALGALALPLYTLVIPLITGKRID
jgi:hypothetical protein